MRGRELVTGHSDASFLCEECFGTLVNRTRVINWEKLFHRKEVSKGA